MRKIAGDISAGANVRSLAICCTRQQLIRVSFLVMLISISIVIVCDSRKKWISMSLFSVSNADTSDAFSPLTIQKCWTRPPCPARHVKFAGAVWPKDTVTFFNGAEWINDSEKRQNSKYLNLFIQDVYVCRVRSLTCVHCVLSC